jgi:hypothetical protein
LTCGPQRAAPCIKARLGTRYQVARVAMSKAFRRLAARGLAERDYYPDAHGHAALGLVLTQAGLPLAHQVYERFRPQWQVAYEAMQARERQWR